MIAKLDNSTLLTYLIGKGMLKELRWCRSRNHLACVEDGGRDVCSTDVHQLVQKSVSVTLMQFTHST